MRIAFDATSLPARPGGAGYYIINLVRSLLALESGHEFIIFTHPADRAHFNLPEHQRSCLVDVADLGRGYRLVWEQVALPGLLHRMEIDLLHSPHYTMPLFTPVPVVVTYHDMTFFLYPAYHILLKRLFFPSMIRLSARRAAAILSVSENTRQDAIELLGISPDKISTSLLGYDPQFRRCQDPAVLQEIRKKYRLPSRFILHVGTIEPRKNLSTLLDAFVLLARSDTEIALVLVGGSGWYSEQLSSQIKGLPIHDRIYLTGYIDRQDMSVIYSLAEVFVYPSIYEGFGLPVLEAMACGAPVITSNVSSMPEIAGEAGILVPPENPEQLYRAMESLLQDFEMANILAQKGQEHAPSFRGAGQQKKPYRLMNGPPGNMVDLSICIVTYKARDHLKECLDSLTSHPPRLTCEIIVVDNFSQDGTLELVRSQYPQVQLVCLPENQGYTIPMNLALRRAQGTYLAQLNPDTVILPGMLDRLVAYLESHPECGICTPKVLNRDGSMQWQCRRSEARPWDVITYFTRLSRAFPKSPRLSGYLMTYQDPDQASEVQAVSGACMFIRREVINQIGFLDERYYAYQEDSDFCLRARRSGWKVMYYPQAQIFHYGAEGGTRVHPYHSAFEWHRSYFRYYSRWFAKDYFFVFNWFFYSLMGVKLGFAMLKILLSQDKYPGDAKTLNHPGFMLQ